MPFKPFQKKNKKDKKESSNTKKVNTGPSKKFMEAFAGK